MNHYRYRKNDKVLITDDVDPLLITGLTRLGYQCDYQPDITLENAKEIVGAYSGIVINTKIKAYKDFLESGKNLQFIARLGSGLDIIDLEVAHGLGIYVLSAPEGNCNAVVEHALGMLLSLLNRLHQADREVKAFLWYRERNRGTELDGKSVGIIGFGHTGRAFAQKLNGFNVDLLVHDPFINLTSLLTENQHEATLDQIQAKCQIISLHVSLNPTSRHLIDHKFLQACQQRPILINTSRGAVVKTADLVMALDEKVISGACLDVFENEKPETFSPDEKIIYSQLYQYDNVVLSPHIAGWTVESKRKIAEVLLKKIEGLEAEK